MIDKFEQFNEKKKISKKASKFISKKIKHLVDKEDRPQKQAVAMAYSYAKKEGLLENQLPIEFGKGDFSREQVIVMLEDVYAKVAEMYNDRGQYEEEFYNAARIWVAKYMENK